MNRVQFREVINSQPADEQPSFLQYFSKCLHQMDVGYCSLNEKIPENMRDFSAVGVSEALAAYAWPAKVEYLHPQPETREIITYEETFEALKYFRWGLLNAIGKNGDVIYWVEEILNWGMGARGKSALEFIDSLDDAPEYLRRICDLSSLNGDTDLITSEAVPNYNSGLSKVHALASTSGLVIYDSRVAFAIGECVSQWAISTGAGPLPDALKFMQAGRRKNNSNNPELMKPRGHENILYKHPVIPGAHKYRWKWLETQMRASWLFEAALEADDSLWPGQDKVTRMHNLEAAFFMVGAYAESITLPKAA